MSVLVAAVDSSAAAQPVLAVARELARLMNAEVEAVCVDGLNGPATAEEMTRVAHVRVHRRSGEVARAIESLAHERDAVAVVIGARRLPSGATPAGHVTLDLVQSLDVPVAVVPPQVRAHPIGRVLVAVEGDGESHALRHLARHMMRGPSLEIVALHVFEPERLPPFGDQPVLETEAWAEEFGRRALREPATGVRVESRVGMAPRALTRAAGELDADLVVVAWHRELGGGHGRIVRELLTEVEVPLLLVPITEPTRDRA
jgi:nucleotide-binding universal stress UspA family protein